MLFAQYSGREKKILAVLAYFHTITFVVPRCKLPQISLPIPRNSDEVALMSDEVPLRLLGYVILSFKLSEYGRTHGSRRLGIAIRWRITQIDLYIDQREVRSWGLE
jgi:hypothetical protein